MNILDYVNENSMILIPTLYIFGSVLKKLPWVYDYYIPIVLMLLGAFLGLLGQGAIWDGIIQGILAAGVAIGIHQAHHQVDKEYFRV